MSPEKFTYDDVLRIREASWRTRLRRASLVAEDLATPAHSNQALEGLARRYHAADGRWAREMILRRWPAVQVMTTISVAVNHFEAGAFWPALSARTRAQGQAFQREWGEAFLANLKDLELADFSDIEDRGLKYLGPILMHAGLPTYCLPDYYRVVTERRRQTPGLTPTALVGWAAQRAVDGRLYNVDKPVERFFRYGGDYAIDVTDRVFELLEVVGAGADGTDVPLPSRFREAALQLRSQGDEALTPAPSRGPASPAQSVAPHLVLDPYGRGVLVRLPAVDTFVGESATWAVSIGESVSTVRSQPAWPGDPAPATDVAIPMPVRSVSAALAGHDTLRSDLMVVDSSDPLLAFTENGEQLPPGLPLRGAWLWLLHPVVEGRGLEIRGTAREIARGVLPPGWANWQLSLMDLSAASGVAAPGSDRFHAIRAVASVRIRTDEPVRGVTSRSGDPVFAQPPSIELPVGNDDLEWVVTVRDEQGMALLERHSIHADADPTEIWNHVQRPLLGRYSIRVRGPWGRGASRDVFIAEGMSIDVSPPWRRFTAGGLVPAMVRAQAQGELHIEPASFALAESERESKIMGDARGQTVPLVVRPPHMSVSYLSASDTIAPSIHSLPLVTEDIAEGGGTLVIDLGEAGAPRLHALSGRREVQVIEPEGGGRPDIHRFNLSRLADSLHSHPRLRLALDAEGELAVATVTPRKLFHDITLRGRALHLEDAPELEGLVAIVYLTRAPWRSGIEIPVVNQMAPLPPAYVNAGPLLVTVRVDDPWLPEPVPAWPSRSSWVPVEAPGWFAGDSAEEEALSKFLAGMGPFPEGDPDLEWVWAILARLQTMRVFDRFVEVAQACSDELRSEPASALVSLAEVAIDPDEMPEVLVRSGLLMLPSDQVGSRAHVAWTPTTALPATLVTGRRLRLSRRDSDEVQQARLVCGSVLDDLLDANDPFAAKGCLDTSAERYRLLDKETRGEFRRAIKLVPGGLLDGDSRVEAALQMLDRQGGAPRWLSERSAPAFAGLTELLRETQDAAGLEAVRARQHPTTNRGWRAFSALSLGWAWVARRAAHGGLAQRVWIESQKHLWADLARIAPELVTIDIILADLLTLARPLDNTEH